MKLKQIVVSIENEPGRLFDVAEALGKAGINLRALNLVDTGAFGQLRLLVSDVPTARRVLMEMQIPAFVNEVVAAVIPDKSGSLAEVLKPLKNAGFSDNDKAIEILQSNGIQLLDAENFGILESNG